jgi:soluble lytic murein transglycosylase-like protein
MAVNNPDYRAALDRYWQTRERVAAFAGDALADELVRAAWAMWDAQLVDQAEGLAAGDIKPSAA